MWATYLTMILSAVWALIVSDFSYRFSIKCVLSLLGAVVINLAIKNLATLGG